MKKVLLLFVGILTFVTVNAQKTVTRVQETQARLLDVTSSAYVHPLTVELKVDENKGRVRDVWELTKEQAEIEMHGDLANIRSYGVFMSSKKHNCDVIVAATFNFKTSDNGNGYELEVVGFPASFTKWATVTIADYEWIRLEMTQTTDDRDKIKAVIKK